MLEDNIIKIVYDAKDNPRKLNSLIEDFLPFIKRCVARTKVGVQSQEDALTVAMLAFADCVKAYMPEKGSFISFAQTSIRNRLIDDFRCENRFSSRNIPILGEDGATDGLVSKLSLDEYKRQQEQLSLMMEIEELSGMLSMWNTSFSELVKVCPKQKRTRAKCQYIAALLLKNDVWRRQLIEKHRMPTKEMCDTYGVSPKILEKFRIYIATICIIHSGDYPMLNTFLPIGRKYSSEGNNHIKDKNFEWEYVESNINTDYFNKDNSEGGGYDE